jgi:acid phosphatase class B
MPRVVGRLIAVSLLAVAGGLAGCAHRSPADAEAAPAAPGVGASGSMVAVSDYIAQLPPPPIVVGFDVDDTALFSTPAFLFAKGRLFPPVPPEGTPEEARAWREWYRTLEARREALFATVVSARDPAKLTGPERTLWEQFWEDVNTRGDVFSPPKYVTRQLIQHHLERGDEVHFITARPETKGEKLTGRLQEAFGSRRLRVLFTGNEPKASKIRGERIRIYYGDADEDIDDANAAGARGVRILRSAWSSNDKRKPAPGTRGEWFVIRGSDL